jgi:hydrogenase expression/formation protein HypE
MRRLVEEVFLDAFGGPEPRWLEDQARLAPPPELAAGGRLAFTTDGYVVDPPEFPGGDVGTLAVNGTVNDLAVGGARPLWLSCAVIIEEGLPVATLRRIARSMAGAASAAGVSIVTGDTKVVGRGAADRLFVTTAGVGAIPPGRDLSAAAVRPGDVAIVSGTLGDHGAAVLEARGDLALESGIESDCAALHGLMEATLAAAPGLRCARDLTRGGLAAALNEIAEASGCAVAIDETALPLREAVRGLCEILGLDPLHLANEGALVAFAPEREAEAALAAMRASPEGRSARIVGHAESGPAGTVTLRTAFGGARLLDLPTGVPLPRIC